MVLFQRILCLLSQSHTTGCFKNIQGAQRCPLAQFNLLTQMQTKMMHCIQRVSLDLLFCFDLLEEASFFSLPLPLPSVGRFSSHSSPIFQSLTIFDVDVYISALIPGPLSVNGTADLPGGTVYCPLFGLILTSV